MKKKLTYTLLLCAIALWGMVFYRIFAGNNPDSGRPLPASSGRGAEGIPTNTGHQDSLLLNYNDPFLPEILPDDNEETADVLYGDEPQPDPGKPVVDWAQVRYLGMIKSSDERKAIALLHINGKDYMLQSGEEAGGYTLMHYRAGSATVSSEGQTAVLQRAVRE